jgi:hypothetical protein
MTVYEMAQVMTRKAVRNQVAQNLGLSAFHPGHPIREVYLERAAEWMVAGYWAAN